MENKLPGVDGRSKYAKRLKGCTFSLHVPSAESAGVEYKPRFTREQRSKAMAVALEKWRASPNGAKEQALLEEITQALGLSATTT